MHIIKVTLSMFGGIMLMYQWGITSSLITRMYTAIGFLCGLKFRKEIRKLFCPYLHLKLQLKNQTFCRRNEYWGLDIQQCKGT